MLSTKLRELLEHPEGCATTSTPKGGVDGLTTARMKHCEVRKGATVGSKSLFSSQAPTAQ